MKKMYGVVTAMTTPFDENDRVDVKGLEEQTEFLIEKEVNCLYPCGTTGEMLNMTCEERECVAETVIHAADGRVPVFIHVGTQTLKDTIRLAQHAHRAGADGIGVVTPAFFGLKDRALVRYYQDVAASVPEDFPIYLYCIPQCASNDLKPEVVEEIAGTTKNVIGIKYSYADCIRLKDYLNVNDGNFSVLFGPDRLFLPALAMGCDGTVSGCSGPMPEHFVNIYKAFKEGNLKEAQEEQKVACDICEILENGADMGVFKAALRMRGVRAGYMRRPLLDMEPAEEERLRKELAAYLM